MHHNIKFSEAKVVKHVYLHKQVFLQEDDDFDSILNWNIPTTSCCDGRTEATDKQLFIFIIISFTVKVDHIMGPKNAKFCYIDTYTGIFKHKAISTFMKYHINTCFILCIQEPRE